jgi:SAM-dependent methyltransferase
LNSALKVRFANAMPAASLLPAEKTDQSVAPLSPPPSVLLSNGERLSLAGFSAEQLDMLHWDQEQKFARAILAAPRGSAERSQITATAYDSICTIQAARLADGAPLVMGLDPRYVRLVLQMLDRQRRRGRQSPSLFEIGFGCGALLAEVDRHGYAVGGIEVSPTMRDQALWALAGRHAAALHLGDLRAIEPGALPCRPSLIYWNDVFEHIAPDEIAEYVAHIHSLLAPGGELVTITPNWLLRPSDVTAVFEPPRTEARGFHFKEYRLVEVTRLLRTAGFRRVATPLFATRRRWVLGAGGCRAIKELIESSLDRLPVRVARLACRGLVMSCTIARKA